MGLVEFVIFCWKGLLLLFKLESLFLLMSK